MNEEAVRSARDLEQARAANQARFPICARLVAELRKIFSGAGDVKVRYMKEGEHEIGKRFE